MAGDSNFLRRWGAIGPWLMACWFVASCSRHSDGGSDRPPPIVAQSSLAPSDPCTTVQKDIPPSERDLATGCARTVDLGIRPLTTGTLHMGLTNAARTKGTPSACCYEYTTIGNR